MKILNGDDDAAGLMGVPLSELYKGGEAPTVTGLIRSVGPGDWAYT